MEKSNKGLILTIVILALLIVAFGSYIIYDKFIKAENNESTNNLIMEESYDYLLNNTNHKITYKYYYNQCYKSEVCDYEQNEYYITASVFMDNKKIGKDEYIIYFSDIPDSEKSNPGDIPLDFSAVKNLIKQGVSINSAIGKNNKYSYPLNKDNLATIKGTDEDYLVLTVKQDHFAVGINSLPIIVNDEGNLIHTATMDENKYELKGQIATQYELNGDQFGIDNNKLYYFESDHCTYINLIVITINNDTAIEEKIELNESDYISAGEWC